MSGHSRPAILGIVRFAGSVPLRRGVNAKPQSDQGWVVKSQGLVPDQCWTHATCVREASG